MFGGSRFSGEKKKNYFPKITFLYYLVHKCIHVSTRKVLLRLAVNDQLRSSKFSLAGANKIISVQHFVYRFNFGKTERINPIILFQTFFFVNILKYNLKCVIVFDQTLENFSFYEYFILFFYRINL